jgi:hypothetical protein
MMTDDDEMHAEIHARFTATIALSQASARLAFASFLASCPEPPKLGTPEHQAMLDGKDATLAMTLAGLHAEAKHGSLQHLTPDDMQKIGAILIGCDTALSRRLGVDMHGRPLN